MKNILLIIKIFTLSSLLVQCSKEDPNSIDVSLIPSSVNFKLTNVDHIFFTSDNGLLIAGVDDHKSTLIKTNYKLETEWTKSDYEWGNIVSGSGGGSRIYWVTILKIFQRSDGSYVCIGNISEGEGIIYHRALVTVLNSQGDQIQKYEFNDIVPKNALRTDDGGYLLFGDKMIKLDQNFNKLWEKKSLDPAFYPSQIVLTGNHGFATTGTFANEQAFLKKYDSVGNEISTKLYKDNSAPHEDGLDLVQLKDNGFLIIGETGIINLFTVNTDYQIIRTNLTGDTLYTKRFGSSGNERLDRFISSDGNEFIVQGTKTYNYQSNPVLFRINSDGKVLNSKDMEKFMMMVYSPLKFYLKVKSLDQSHVTFTKIEAANLFN